MGPEYLLYIYTINSWHINVGKYTSPMDPMRYLFTKNVPAPKQTSKNKMQWTVAFNVPPLQFRPSVVQVLRWFHKAPPVQTWCSNDANFNWNRTCIFCSNWKMAQNNWFIPVWWREPLLGIWHVMLERFLDYRTSTKQPTTKHSDLSIYLYRYSFC